MSEVMADVSKGRRDEWREQLRSGLRINMSVRLQLALLDALDAAEALADSWQERCDAVEASDLRAKLDAAERDRDAYGATGTDLHRRLRLAIDECDGLHESLEACINDASIVCRERDDLRAKLDRRPAMGDLTLQELAKLNDDAELAEASFHGNDVHWHWSVAYKLIAMARRTIAAERKLRVLECDECGGDGQHARVDDDGVDYEETCPQCGGFDE